MEVAVYVHVPFCQKRCTYCDFNTYTGLLSLQASYTRAICHEIELWGERHGDLCARTLYFGGGTPSLLDPRYLSTIINAVRRYFDLPWEAEVTLEANPGTLTPSRLDALRRAGVSRLSLGVQSSHSRELLMLGRIHSWQQAVKSYDQAREAGFVSLSLDLMFGLPGQTLSEWRVTLERTLALSPDHLSLYALTLEPGTPLAEVIAVQEFPAPDGDLAADMYELASELLYSAGFWQYEISNWARGDTNPAAVWALPPLGNTAYIGPHICQHNLIYWRNEPWLGLGAGAHSWFQGRRWSHHPHPKGYIHAMRRGKIGGVESEDIPPELAYGETMMMGLRLAEGVTTTRFREMWGVELPALYGETLVHLADLGLLSWREERARLTPRGRLLGNQVFQEFLPF